MAAEKTVIIGAGPAGLTAGYYLTKSKQKVLLIEKDKNVGGISQTYKYKNNRFDLGPHRFFTKSPEVMKLWQEILKPRKFLVVPRLTRIYYDQKFYPYPIKILPVLKNLGAIRSVKILLSFFKTKLQPIRPETNFSSWVSNRFGVELFKTFFKTYTEKVWGISSDKLSADWSAQRIKGVSFTSAVLNALPFFSKKNQAKSLIESYYYPPFGAGQMWESASQKIVQNGGEIMLDSTIVKLSHAHGNLNEITFSDNQSRHHNYKNFSNVLSSMPIQDLISCLDPQPDGKIIKAAKSLNYRDLVLVALLIKKTNLFADNWIYIHDPNVKVGRIMNTNNWSKKLTADPSHYSLLSLEYYCNQGDNVWMTDDKKLIQLAKRELSQLGIVDQEFIVDGTVKKYEKTYPVYDETYEKNVDLIKKWLEKNCQNLTLIGRNGMHKYNNQDHSMMTGLLAAKNILDQGKYDLWKVHSDASYDETVSNEIED